MDTAMDVGVKDAGIDDRMNGMIAGTDDDVDDGERWSERRRERRREHRYERWRGCQPRRRCERGPGYRPEHQPRHRVDSTVDVGVKYWRGCGRGFGRGSRPGRWYEHRCGRRRERL